MSPSETGSHPPQHSLYLSGSCRARRIPKHLKVRKVRSKAGGLTHIDVQIKGARAGAGTGQGLGRKNEESKTLVKEAVDGQ